VTLKRALFLLLAFLLPLDGLPSIRVAVGKLSVSSLDLLIMAVLYLELLESALTGSRAPRYSRRISALLLLAAAFSTVSLLYIPSYRMGFDIRVTLNLIYLLVIVFLASRMIRDRVFLRQTLLAVLMGGVVMATSTVLKSLGFELPGDLRTTQLELGPFVVGVTGVTNVGIPFTVPILAAFPVVLLRTVLPSLWLRLPMIAILAMAAAISFTRHLWVALVIEVLVLLALTARFSGRSHRRAIAASALLAGLIGLVVGAPQIVDFLTGLRPTTVYGRLAGFLHAIDLISESPMTLLFGAGKGLFVATFRLSTVPHSFFLDLLNSKGLVTLLVIVAVLVSLAVHLWRSARWHAGAGRRDHAAQAVTFLTILAGLMGAGLFTPIMSSLAFLMMLGIATAFVSLDERSRAVPP